MKILAVLFFCAIAPWAYAAGVRPELLKPYLVAPAIVDGRNLTDVWVFPRDINKEFMVESASLLEALRPILKEQNLKILEALVRKEKVLSLASIEASGLKPFWNEANLELHIAIPLNYRKAQDLSLTYVEVDENKYYRPDRQSGYLNLRLSQPYQYGEGAPDNSHLPLVGRADLVENINGFVLETGTEFQEQSEAMWNRQDTRIRKDDEENMIRYTAGDLTVLARGFQIAPALGGASLTREFSIQPYRTLKPISRSEIEIKRPSVIDVYVNGLLTSQQRVLPGRFNVRDFPIAAGLSDVKIKVRDDLGQEESYDFSLLFENSILTEGVQEFSYNVGLPWTQNFNGDRTYLNPGSFSSLYHRWGYSDHVTLGVNFQNYLDKTMPGIEYSQIAPWGLASLDTAYSTNNGLAGWGNRLTYRSLDRMYGRNVPFVVAAEVQVRDPNFQPPLVTEIINNSLLRRYDVQVSSAFGFGSVFGAGGSYEVVPTGSSDRRFYRTNLSIPFNSSNRIEFSLVREVSDRSEDRGLISYFWAESQGHYSVSAYHETITKGTTVAVSKNNQYNYDDWRGTASIQQTGDNTTASLYGEYLTQPAAYRLDQYTNIVNGKSLNTTTLGVSTGFAWVGDRGAFTQPITDSFVLIDAVHLPQNQELLINPLGAKGEAQLGPRSATVLKDRTSYYRYLVNIDSTSLGMGYLMDKEYYGVMPTYRSGILIDLHIQRKIMVKGRLKLQNGTALSLVAGDIMNAQGQLVDNTFFTNRSGEFVIEGLSPGEYIIITDRKDLKSLRLLVKDDAKNSIHVGDLVVTKEQK